MARRSTLDLAKDRIIPYMDNDSRQVFRYQDIYRILSDNGKDWNLANYIMDNPWRFSRYLDDIGMLSESKLSFPSENHRMLCWRNPSVFSLAQAIDRRGFLVHYSAMALHELTEQVPKTVYFKSEKLRSNFVKDRREELTQSRIDAAFKRVPRTSNRFAIWKDWNICHLVGSLTNNLGVIKFEIDGGPAVVRVTNLERTLVDIVCRSWYAGGIGEVAKAYRLAKGKVSVNKLFKMLNDLEFVYPYHQAIGFYLEKAGVYKDSQLDIFESIPMKHDFYLTYQMKDMAYSKRWKLYYPSTF